MDLEWLELYSTSHINIVMVNIEQIAVEYFLSAIFLFVDKNNYSRTVWCVMMFSGLQIHLYCTFIDMTLHNLDFMRVTSSAFRSLHLLSWWLVHLSVSSEHWKCSKQSWQEGRAENSQGFEYFTHWRYQEKVHWGSD